MADVLNVVHRCQSINISGMIDVTLQDGFMFAMVVVNLMGKVTDIVWMDAPQEYLKTNLIQVVY